jgi:hypothetical protein
MTSLGTVRKVIVRPLKSVRVIGMSRVMTIAAARRVVGTMTAAKKVSATKNEPGMTGVVKRTVPGLKSDVRTNGERMHGAKRSAARTAAGKRSAATKRVLMPSAEKTGGAKKSGRATVSGARTGPVLNSGPRSWPRSMATVTAKFPRTRSSTHPTL